MKTRHLKIGILRRFWRALTGQQPSRILPPADDEEEAANRRLNQITGGHWQNAASRAAAIRKDRGLVEPAPLPPVSLDGALERAAAEVYRLKGEIDSLRNDLGRERLQVDAAHASLTKAGLLLVQFGPHGNVRLAERIDTLATLKIDAASRLQTAERRIAELTVPTVSRKIRAARSANAKRSRK